MHGEQAHALCRPPKRAGEHALRLERPSRSRRLQLLGAKPVQLELSRDLTLLLALTVEMEMQMKHSGTSTTGAATVRCSDTTHYDDGTGRAGRL